MCNHRLYKISNFTNISLSIWYQLCTPGWFLLMRKNAFIKQVQKKSKTCSMPSSHKPPSNYIFTKSILWYFHFEKKILVSKWLLVKKVVIMSEGQSPKITGSICNVPAEIMDVRTLLPRQTNSNGLVKIKLARRLSCLLWTKVSRYCFETVAIS